MGNPLINLPSRNGRFISPMYEDLGDDLLGLPQWVTEYITTTIGLHDISAVVYDGWLTKKQQLETQWHGDPVKRQQAGLGKWFKPWVLGTPFTVPACWACTKFTVNRKCTLPYIYEDMENHFFLLGKRTGEWIQTWNTGWCPKIGLLSQISCRSCWLCHPKLAGFLIHWFQVTGDFIEETRDLMLRYSNGRHMVVYGRPTTWNSCGGHESPPIDDYLQYTNMFMFLTIALKWRWVTVSLLVA